MRSHCFLAVANALANHVGTHQTCNRSVDVNHSTASKVDRAVCEDETSSIPHHVCDWNVAECEPDCTEQQHCRELDALSECTYDQGTSNGREFRLERDEDEFRDHHAFSERG